MNDEGVIIPYPEMYKDKSRRQEALPILMVRFPDGREVPYWNTFFQKINYPKLDQFDLLDLTQGKYDIACLLADQVNQQLDMGLTPGQMDFSGYEGYASAVRNLLESRRRYLGQMDVNLKSPMVWEWFDKVMTQLASLGTSLIRLDAVFCLLKAPGKDFDATSPEAWELLDKIGKMAGKHGMDVIPEHHTAYKTGAHLLQWKMGYSCYDYFLPLLLIDATERGDSQWVYKWAKEQIDADVRSINMLGCHDGIPLRDPRGALPDENVDKLERILVTRGGRQKYVRNALEKEVYQMDISYYSAMNCDDRRMTLARAVQMFMPGKPQVWYQDLLAGANDLQVFERIPDADNREINRHNYTLDEIRDNLQRPVVKEQIRLMQLRNTHPAFNDHAKVSVKQPDGNTLILSWTDGTNKASLKVDFSSLTYEISCS